MPVQMNIERLREAERFFHERIPITRAMGLRVLVDSAHAFAVEAPVALNHNHLQTAFGGSVNAVATLAAYGFLWLELVGEEVELVVASSSIRFLQPVRETIRAACLAPSDPKLQSFHAALSKEKKARIILQVRVEEDGQEAARFGATFVAHQKAK